MAELTREQINAIDATASLNHMLEVASDKEGLQYLGDPKVLEYLIRNILGEFHRRTTEPGLSQAQQDQVTIDTIAQCVAAADILLGNVSSFFAPVAGWNEPGGIDVWLAKMAYVDETLPRLRVAGALLEMIGQYKEILVYAARDDTSEMQWRHMPDGLTEDWTYLLQGIDPSERQRLEEEALEREGEDDAEGDTDTAGRSDRDRS